jgi:oxygen-independent coproporphyrinogen-3 oxidase
MFHVKHLAPHDDWRHGGFGLYVHWPFCQSKCPYCDFNSHVSNDVDHTEWRHTYNLELEHAGRLAPGRVLNSVFFGGGTPSLMEPETVRSVLEAARAHWSFANDIEITLEANPTSVESDKLRAFRDAGITRVSLGAQSLREDDLRRLGRRHSPDEALAAIAMARAIFENVSFDIIYARQNQTLADWRSELEEILLLAPDHLSLYQLTIEDGTAFGALHARGKLSGLPNEDLAADLYRLTQEMCCAAGLEAYEVSNHARPGHESKHNSIYWRYGDFVGLGPGAHGRITIGASRFATETPSSPSAWLNQVRLGNSQTLRALSGLEQAEEMLMMGMRLNEGISLSRYRALSGVDLDESARASLVSLGLVEEIGDRLSCTTKGRPLLNAIIRELLA